VSVWVRLPVCGLWGDRRSVLDHVHEPRWRNRKHD